MIFMCKWQHYKDLFCLQSNIIIIGAVINSICLNKTNMFRCILEEKIGNILFDVNEWAAELWKNKTKY